MTDPADFLSRWSRRKREAEKDEPEGAGERTPAAARSPEEIGKPETDTGAPEKNKEPPAGAEAKREELAFDLSQLPSIESIAADTDIRPFLARGVPSALRQAALRRAWSADPKIRDFIEVAENQFDFNAPGEILGFDFSPPTGDIRRMIADIFGKKPAGDSEAEAPQETRRIEEAAPTAVPTSSEAPSHPNVTESAPRGEASHEEQPAAAHGGTAAEPVSVRQTLVAQHNERDVAAQNDDVTREEEILPARRSHGGAMPK